MTTLARVILLATIAIAALSPMTTEAQTSTERPDDCVPEQYEDHYGRIITKSCNDDSHAGAWIVMAVILIGVLVYSFQSPSRPKASKEDDHERFGPYHGGRF